MKPRRLFIFAVLFFLLCSTISPVRATDFRKENALRLGVEYLYSGQSNEGGIKEEGAINASPELSDWVLLAHQSVKIMSRDGEKDACENNRRKLAQYVLQNGEMRATTDYARKLLALQAASLGEIHRDINLREALLKRQKKNGQFADYAKGEERLVNAHIWSCLALKYSKADFEEEKALAWLKSQQNSDGGFSWLSGGKSDSDTTAMALRTLFLLGEDNNTATVKEALHFLSKSMVAEGGIRGFEAEANSASTSWTIMLINSMDRKAVFQEVGLDSKKLDAYLLSQQDEKGYFYWKNKEKSAPVLMTSYAVIALAGRAFPPELKKMREMVFALNDNKVLIAEKEVSISRAPFMLQGRIMVPLRIIAENYGYRVSWQEKTGETVLISEDESNKSIIVSPVVAGGVSFVSLRYISEELKMNVSWDATNKIARISY